MKKFKPKIKYHRINITKDITGYQFPVNATVFVKIAMIEKLRQKFNNLFTIKSYSIIVLPNNEKLDTYKLKFIVDKKGIIGNLFNGKFEYENLIFDKNSVTIFFLNYPEENFYNLVALIAKKFNLKKVLVYHGKSYEIKIISPK